MTETSKLPAKTGRWSILAGSCTTTVVLGSRVWGRDRTVDQPPKQQHTHAPEKVKVKVAQSCPTLCNPMEYKVHGILQARILEWVAYPLARGSS